ncbi:MAG: hypothetical protein CVT66_05205 [Actinobacteria bacterium HGW-Actinobacteria-6]|jgi:hypothetical protein|nr:MAG: hypothetical protein CVT66_05205 [Actinobacteria bacterium HGW-Actinobacteria-6]
MTPALMIAVAVVVISSAATIAVSAAYKWQVTSKGYITGMRIVGVATVLALTAVTAWTRSDDTVAVVLIVVGGFALAVGYLWLHMRLTKKLSDAGVESPL